MNFKKFVVDVSCEDATTDYQISKAIRECLATLSHKKFKLDGFRRVSVIPVTGSLEAAINLVNTIKSETEQTAENHVTNHVDDHRHGGSDWCCCS